MHIVTDENGNICPHAHTHEHAHTHTYEHTHAHEHEHGQEENHEHCHEHGQGGCCRGQEQDCHSHDHGDEGHCHGCGGHGGEPSADKNAALLKYMLDHNTHHASELDQMADKLAAEGHAQAAEQIRKAVDEFQKGNLYLNLALSLVNGN